MEKQWEKDDSVFNELYYKELIGKKILFEHIGHIISNQLWYQEKRAYRPQLIAYTFSRLVLAAKEKGLKLNYRKMWDLQNIPECLDEDISKIAKLVFDAIYDDNRVNAHIETYCKKVECWNVISKEPVIEERFDPDRTILSLSFFKKVSEKSGEKKVAKKKWRKKSGEKKWRKKVAKKK